MYRPLLSFSIGILLLCGLVFATEGYYAGITITISPDGNALFTSQTNYPQLQSTSQSSFITNEAHGWTLKLAPAQLLEVYTYRIEFPPHTVLENARFSGEYSIDTTDNGLTVIGFDKNAPLDIYAHYTIQTTQQETPTTFPIFEVVGVVILIGLIFAGYYIFVHQKKKQPAYPLEALTERQQQLFTIIRKKNSVTQAELKKITNFPKASLSRNIATLERKGLIRKERKGMTMLLLLKKN